VLTSPQAADTIGTAADEIVSPDNAVPVVADGVIPTAEELAVVSTFVNTGASIVRVPQIFSTYYCAKKNKNYRWQMWEWLQQ
jgi:hypothetical protein